MPVRITCPSCSATLSIKDEHASRAVKCPKCGGIIPAQPAPPATVSEAEAVATVPPPAPEPKTEPRDEPDPPAKTKTGGKITGAPTPASSKARDEDENEDDRPRKKRSDEDGDEDDRPKRKTRDEDDRAAEDDRPRKKRDDREDEDDRPRKKRDEEQEDRPRRRRDEEDRDEDDDRPRKRRRDDDEDDEDRPRRRRRDEDDEDDDRPVVTRRKPPPKSNAPVILAVVGFLLLSCCGAGGYGAYWFANKVKEEAEKLGTQNAAVTKANYDKLVRGTTTRAQAEEIFKSKGRPATSADLAKIFGTDKSTIASWQVPVDKNRAVLWQNGEDYVLVMFHPNADADARVQMKDWKPKTPPGASEGLSDDAAFVQKYPGKDDVSGPAVEVTAEELATAFKSGKGAADAKYKDKVVLVEGVLDAIDIMPDGVMYARLVGTGTVAMPGNVQPRCVVQNVPAETNKVFNLSKGQTVKFRGKCAGLSGPFVDVMNAKVESSGQDPAVSTSAANLLNLYANNEEVADERYKGKLLTVTSAVVESKTADAVYFVAKTTKPTPLKIKVAVAGDFRKLYESLKPGDARKLKGECGGKLGNDVFLNGAWIAP